MSGLSHPLLLAVGCLACALRNHSGWEHHRGPERDYSLVSTAHHHDSPGVTDDSPAAAGHHSSTRYLWKPKQLCFLC